MLQALGVAVFRCASGLIYPGWCFVSRLESRDVDIGVVGSFGDLLWFHVWAWLAAAADDMNDSGCSRAFLYRTLCMCGVRGCLFGSLGISYVDGWWWACVCVISGFSERNVPLCPGIVTLNNNSWIAVSII